MTMANPIKISLVGGLIILSLLLWFSFVPSGPTPLRNDAGATSSSAYRAGGSSCHPEKLSKLADDAALAEFDRCADAAEEHRLKTEDLIQQMRSADAAEASVLISYEVAKMTLLGLIIGGLTCAAAFAAAFYARLAYKEAEKSRVHQGTATKLQLEPFVYWKETSIKIHEMKGNVAIEADAHLFNAGSTPAFNLSSDLKIYLRKGKTKERLLIERITDCVIIPPSDRRRLLIYFDVTDSEWADIKEYRRDVLIELDATFNSQFEDGMTLSERRAGAGTDLTSGELYIDDPDDGDPMIPNLIDENS